MDVQTVDDTVRTNQWSTACNSARVHAASMAQLCSPPFAELIADASRPVCDADPPKNNTEYAIFLARSQKLTAVVSSVVHANQMAQIYPAVAEETLIATRLFCDRVDMGGDVLAESSRLSSEISSIC